MKPINIKKGKLLLPAMLFGVGMTAVSCVEDVDSKIKESNDETLYVAQGKTIEDFIAGNDSLSAFNYILTRAGYDKKLSTYGQYTCYVPDNDAVYKYIDSLYNDKEATVDHNSMTANSLEGLSDSLCTDISEYHLVNSLVSSIEMSGGSTITTILGRSLSVSTNSDGKTVLNDVAVITSQDNEMTNGYVHIMNGVAPRSTRYIGETFKRLDDYKIFSEALQLTGLSDSMLIADRGITYTMSDGNHSDTGGQELYYPKECRVGFTVFAESDAVLKQNGINNINDLIAYANNAYAGAAGWYDYLNEKGKSVSTGTDYTNRFNALNMFVAYHILYCSMAKDQLVFERKDGVSDKVSKWNYVNGGEPYDYYETMLPHTLMKLWQPQPKGDKTVYINRWRENNTLTDEVGTTGSTAMHTLRQQGVVVTREDIQAYNGYIHPIQGMLVYDANVPNGVLFERLRFESTTFLPEFINNGIRYYNMDQVSGLNGGGSGARVAFPLDYFENVVSYTAQNQFRYNVKGDYRAYQADAFQGWGAYDLAVKLPHVPKTGLYEFRLFYSPMGHGGMMQFYIGTSTDVQKMTALDIPLDVRIEETDPRIGWTAFYNEDDLGVATDQAMRNRGYMRAPCSFRGHPDGTGDMKDNNCRGDGTVTLRRILGRVDMKQSEDYWFRIKNVISDETDLKWQLDFIELVPVNVVDNDKYTEDWY